MHLFKLNMHINCFFLKSPEATEEHPRLFNVGVLPLGAGARYETGKQDFDFLVSASNFGEFFRQFLMS